MSAAPPAPARHAHTVDLVSRARTEALAMTSPAPAPDSGPDPAPGLGSGPGELAARALRAHSTLAQGLGRSIPVTGLEPGGGPHALAAFLAVYAAQHTHRTPAPPRRPEPRPPCTPHPQGCARTRGAATLQVTAPHEPPRPPAPSLPGRRAGAPVPTPDVTRTGTVSSRARQTHRVRAAGGRTGGGRTARGRRANATARGRCPSHGEQKADTVRHVQEGGRNRVSRTEEFEELRPLLFSIAYRILGSESRAHHAVEETRLGYERASAVPASPRAFLSAEVTRIARAARHLAPSPPTSAAAVLLLERLSPGAGGLRPAGDLRMRHRTDRVRGGLLGGGEPPPHRRRDDTIRRPWRPGPVLAGPDRRRGPDRPRPGRRRPGPGPHRRHHAAQEVDGGPGAVFHDRNGTALGALALGILDGRIQTVRWTTAPNDSGGRTRRPDTPPATAPPNVP